MSRHVLVGEGGGKGGGTAGVRTSAMTNQNNFNNHKLKI